MTFIRGQLLAAEKQLMVEIGYGKFTIRKNLHKERICPAVA